MRTTRVYLSVKYDSIRAYQVTKRTGAFFGRAMFTIFTNINGELRRMTTIIQNEQIDFFDSLWHFNNKILGTDCMRDEQKHLRPYSIPFVTNIGDNITNGISWLADDMSQITATNADKEFHNSLPVLQANEICEDERLTSIQTYSLSSSLASRGINLKLMAQQM